jgi:hypothetical protein
MTDNKTPTSPPGGGEADRNKPGVTETDVERAAREQREREQSEKDAAKPSDR